MQAANRKIQGLKRMIILAVLIFAVISVCLIGIFSAYAADMPSQRIHDTVKTDNLIWAEETSVQLNLGVNFTANMSGKITKVMIYARADESGDHTVKIWNADTQEQLAGPYIWTVTAPGSDQWLEYTLPEAFAVQTGVKYAVTVSNSAEFMFYPCYEGFFAQPVNVPAFNVDINSGCFGLEVNYPSNAGVNGRSFLRDIVFVPDGIYKPDAAESNGSNEASIHGTVPMEQVTFADETLPLMLGTTFSVKNNGMLTKIKAYTDSGASGKVTVAVWDADEQVLIAGPYEWTLDSGILGWQEYTLPEAVRLNESRKYIAAVSTYGEKNIFSLSEGYFASGKENDTFITYENSGVFTTDLNAMPSVNSARSFLRDVVFVADDKKDDKPVTPPDTGDNDGYVLCAALVCTVLIVCCAATLCRNYVKKNGVFLIFFSFVCALTFYIFSGNAVTMAADIEKGEKVSIHSDVQNSDIVWAEESIVLNIGVKFSVKVKGQITEIKLYTAADESGIHSVALWDVESESIIAGPFEWNISAGTEGWQSYTLPKAVNIDAETLYVATVSNNSGFLKFPLTNKYFASPDPNSIFNVYNASGVFGVGSDTFPENTFDARTYYRDVVFVPGEDYTAGGSVPDDTEQEPSGSTTIHGNLEGVSVYHAQDPDAHLNMGTRFAAKKSGSIVKVKLYTSMEEKSCIRYVTIYDAYDGNILAGPYTWKTAGNKDGWQYFNLPESLRISAWHDYIVTVTTGEDKAYYSLVENYFTDDRLNGDLFILYPDGGVFTEENSIPELTYNQRTFLRDIVFIPDEKVATAPSQNASLSEKNAVWLSNLVMGDGFSYSRPVMFDKSGEYDEIFLADKSYDKGITFYACPFENGSFAEYNIENLGMKTFVATVGITEAVGINTDTGTAQFVIILDGKEIFRSEVLKFGDMLQINADISGGKILRIVLENGGDGNFGDLGVWADAALSKFSDREAIYADLAEQSSAEPTHGINTQAPKESASLSVQKPKQTGENNLSYVFYIVIAIIVLAVAGAAAFIIVKKKTKGDV